MLHSGAGEEPACIASATNGKATVSVFENADARVQWNGRTKRAYLTRNEKRFLLELARSHARVCTDAQLLQLFNEESTSNIVNVYAHKVRRKLANAHPDAAGVIKTVVGRGYSFGELRTCPVLASTTIGGSTVSILTDGNLSVGTGTDHTLLRLEPTVQNFMLALAKGDGKVRTHRMIHTELYASSKKPDVKIFDVFTRKIRQEIEGVNREATGALRTVWGRGYAFGPQPIPALSPPSAFPPPDIRWTASRKAFIVNTLEEGLVSEERLYDYYPDLSAAELNEWKSLYVAYGRKALSALNIQQYPLAA